MNRRDRSKSRGTKAERGKSPGKPTPKSPRQRGRPSKKETADKAKGRRASRSRTRDKPQEKVKEQAKRSRSRSLSSSRAIKNETTSSKKRETRAKDELTLMKPAIVVNDILRKGSKLNDVVRRSVEKEIEKAKEETLRRSSRRIGGRTEIESSSKSEWTKTVITESTPKLSLKSEFGGWFGVLCHILVRFGVVVFTMFGCTKDQCDLKPFHIPRNINLYFNPQSAAIFTGFFILQLLLLILPVGRVVRLPNSSTTFRSNGVLALLLTAATLGGLWYTGYPITIIYERWVSLITSAYLSSWLIGIALFIKGGRASLSSLNPYGNTGNKVYDMEMGREIHPLLFKTINVKLLLLRCLLIGSIALDCLLALKGWEVRKEISATLITSVALHAICSLDALWFEESLTSSFEIQYEGTGLMMTQGYLIYPFYAALIPRFVLTHRVELPPIQLASSIILFIVGFFIYRASNLQKAAFRKNPNDPALAYLETIPTSRGKKLLVSGWWGLVKHPNYLGDIILLWGWALTAGFTHILPYVVPLSSTLILIHRARRDFNRCQEKYQGAWQEYHRRVPYSIIPGVY